jgi:hypothetical protein
VTWQVRSGRLEEGGGYACLEDVHKGICAMIIDLPTSDDFFTTGWRFLDYGWSQSVGLLTKVEGTKEWDEEYYRQQAEQEFWELASPALVTSLALVQQGIELLLKGCIAQVSPYLLLAQPQNWPQKDVPFSAFKTIDAQNLVKVYNTVKSSKLSNEFEKAFNKSREHRNAAFHGVSNSITVPASEILRTVFMAVENLTADKKWLQIRRSILEKSPLITFSSLEHDINRQMMADMEVIVKTFSPEEVEKYTGFQAGEKSYHCPVCEYTSHKFGGKTYFTKVLTDSSTSIETLYCFCCCRNVEVITENCQNPICDSSMAGEDGKCLKCGYMNE